MDPTDSESRPGVKGLIDDVREFAESFVSFPLGRYVLAPMMVIAVVGGGYGVTRAHLEYKRGAQQAQLAARVPPPAIELATVKLHYRTFDVNCDGLEDIVDVMNGRVYLREKLLDGENGMNRDFWRSLDYLSQKPSPVCEK